MLKHTLYFGNPAYLSLHNAQMVVSFPEKEGFLPDRTIPIEDIAYVIVDNNQVTLTQALISHLLDNNVALVTCDKSHLPVGLMLPLSGHTLQSERFRHQIDASKPLKKQLWRQTMQAKIANQAAVLESLGIEAGNLRAWVDEVRSGDSSNFEARAAVYYWKNAFNQIPDFTRNRDGDFPNNLLNYGYAILRAIIARALVGSGLLPTLGIHHHNRYNAYCLADDIMEPYRPVVDRLVLDIIDECGEIVKLTTDIKRKFLSIPVTDVKIEGHTSPLMVAATTTSASLYRCFTGECRNIAYPSL